MSLTYTFLCGKHISTESLSRSKPLCLMTMRKLFRVILLKLITIGVMISVRGTIKFWIPITLGATLLKLVCPKTFVTESLPHDTTYSSLFHSVNYLNKDIHVLVFMNDIKFKAV